MVALRIFLLATSASAFLVPRDFSSVFSDLQKIYADTVNVDNAIKNYTNTNQLGPLLNAFSQLDDDVKRAKTDTDASPTATYAQAAQILNYIRTSAIPITRQSLNDLVAKKSNFNAQGLCGAVVGQLSGIRNDTNALSRALVSKAPTVSKSSASALSSSVLGLFNSASTAYGPCSTTRRR